MWVFFNALMHRSLHILFPNLIFNNYNFYKELAYNKYHAASPARPKVYPSQQISTVRRAIPQLCSLHWTYTFSINHVYILTHHKKIEQKIHDRVKTRERIGFVSSFVILKVSDFKKWSCGSHPLLFTVLRIKLTKNLITH